MKISFFLNTFSKNVLYCIRFLWRNIRFIKNVAKLFFAVAKVFLFALVPIKVSVLSSTIFISFTRNFSFNRK